MVYVNGWWEATRLEKMLRYRSFSFFKPRGLQTWTGMISSFGFVEVVFKILNAGHVGKKEKGEKEQTRLIYHRCEDLDLGG